MYESTREVIASGTAPDRAGRLILPSQFTGSVRNIKQHYHDSMAICRQFGIPALFVTFTANPMWEGIQSELIKGSNGEPIQGWIGRPDLVARVFHMKNEAMLKEFRKGRFGRYIGHVQFVRGGLHVRYFGRAMLSRLLQVIEWQKRGLTHSHTLFWLDGPWTDPDHIDHFVSAEIPPEDKYPRLHRVVIKHMLHHPCGPAHGNPEGPCCLDDTGRPKPSYSKFSEEIQ